MSLTIKAFLAQDGQWDSEIRRFQIPADASTSFLYLQKKVCEMFPLLREGNVTLFWKDNDGDAVAFSTDEELTEALGHVSDGIFKVHVTPKGSEENHMGGGPEIHPGVTRDGFPMFPFGPHGWPHGPRGRHGPHGRHFVPPPPFRRWMQRYMKRWHKRNTPEWNSSGEEAEKTENEEETAEKMNESKEQGGSNGEQGESSGEDCLQDAGDCMVAMMTAVGLESDDNAESGEKTDDQKQEKQVKWKGHGRKCHERKTHGFGGHRGRRLFHCMGRHHGRYGPYHFGPWAFWGLSLGDDFHGDDGPWKKKCCRKEKKMCRSERSPSKERKQKNKGETAEKHFHKKDKRRNRHSVEKSPEHSNEVVMVLDDEPSSKPNGVPLVPQPNTANPGQVPLNTSRPHSEALQQLLAMGFTDEGGWLARLLEAKHGDINGVLNAIRPQNQ